ncbi:hypothetical protein [Xanthomonas arboricola]|uniref:hypothetical protein n=1 Tax=Xanthomonas arboricola TaxID=56448 RepID=UPI0015E2CFE4|nr:hypothetical protein [Xanthomonas arboricola]
MSGPEARKAAGLGFDYRAESIVAQGSLLLQMTADAGEQFVGQSFIEQGAVGSGSLNQVVAKRKPAGMWCECAVPALAQIGWATGAAIRRRVVDEANTHWIEFNVAIAAKEVTREIYKLLSRTVLFEVNYIASIRTFCVTRNGASCSQ